MVAISTSTSSATPRYGPSEPWSAAVNVQAGLRQQDSGTPRQLIYNLTLNCTGQWQINEITYRNERVFQLRPYLEALVNPTP